MEEEVPAKGALCGPKCKSRYIMAILASVGMAFTYGLKVGLHVTIVTMLNHTAINKANETKKGVVDGPFDWNPLIQGNILSSYFYGYLVSELPGGALAEQLSAKWVFFFAISINVVATLLSPLMATLHYGALIAMRVLMGIGGGVTFPACHVLLAEWAPKEERSVMSSIVYAGTALGTVIFMLISGAIAENVCWQAVFYIEGGLATIWLVLWTWLIADSPAKQRLMSQEERDFIKESLATEEHGGHNLKLPIKAFFTSGPFLAILLAHTCSNWGWYMILIELPTYLHDVLKLDMKNNPALTAIPFFTMWLFSMIVSFTLDKLRSKNKISTTVARKIATLIASVVPMACFIILLCIEDKIVAYALITIATTAIGAMFCGFLSNHIDIAPNFAGILVGITNTTATIPGIVVPLLLGILLEKDKSQASWNIMFYITISLYALLIIGYSIFASGEMQPWNHPEPREPHEQQPLKQK